MNNCIELEQRYCAHNYHPLPVVIVRGEGVHLWDADGKQYLDMMSAYSAVSHGHRHPRILDAAIKQLGQVAVTSRAFHSDKLGAFAQRVCELTRMDAILPMNTGAEAVETAIKAARKWAYKVKRVPDGKAEIIVCDGNFHGRTIAIVGMSSEWQYKDGFGPFPTGFKRVPYGDLEALERAITPHTAAFMVEPIQGEAGIIVPPQGYLKRCQELCRRHNVLLICDEIQTGLGRTGKVLACWHDEVTPDAVTLGKALGGGIMPVSALLARREVMDVFHPGDHGSTFGGNPLACAIGLEALNVLVEERLPERSAELGAWFLAELKKISSPLVKDVRGRGLFIGLEVDLDRIKARAVVEKLMTRGLLSKETHESVVRLAPPLVISHDDLAWAARQIAEAIAELE